MPSVQPCVKCSRGFTNVKFGYLCQICRGNPPRSKHSCATKIEADVERNNLKARYYQDNRWQKLLRATNHIEPYTRIDKVSHPAGYLAARQVIAAYRQGKLELLSRDTLRKAAGRSKSRKQPHPDFFQVEGSNGDHLSRPI